MTSPGSLAAIHAHWAARLGCPLEMLLRPRIVAVAADATDDWNGAFFLQHGASCLISVPRSFLPEVRERLQRQTLATVFTPDFAADLFGDAVEKVIGPAWLGYADFSDFHPVSAVGVRPLTAEDSAALRRLAQACGDEWALSGIDLSGPANQGRFFAGELVAAGMIQHSSPRIENVGIVTHPAYRGQGHGKAVVSALTGLGLNHGAIMQYRTLQNNLPSMAIACTLGYQSYGCTIAVRLKTPVG